MEYAPALATAVEAARAAGSSPEEEFHRAGGPGGRVSMLPPTLRRTPRRSA